MAKEVVKSPIFYMGNKERLIKVNSSAFPENLVESELFGYEEGSFTGAVKGGKLISLSILYHVWPHLFTDCIKNAEN